MAFKEQSTPLTTYKRTRSAGDYTAEVDALRTLFGNWMKDKSRYIYETYEKDVRFMTRRNSWTKAWSILAHDQPEVYGGYHVAFGTGGRSVNGKPVHIPWAKIYPEADSK